MGTLPNEAMNAPGAISGRVTHGNVLSWPAPGRREQSTRAGSSCARLASVVPQLEGRPDYAIALLHDLPGPNGLQRTPGVVAVVRVDSVHPLG